MAKKKSLHSIGKCDETDRYEIQRDCVFGYRVLYPKNMVYGHVKFEDNIALNLVKRKKSWPEAGDWLVEIYKDKDKFRFYEMLVVSRRVVEDAGLIYDTDGFFYQVIGRSDFFYAPSWMFDQYAYKYDESPDDVTRFLDEGIRKISGS